MLTARRFAIRRALILRPLLVLLGATAGRSYVELAGDELRVRFGWLFDKTFRLSELESVRRRGWLIFMGLGWRTDLFSLIALVGSTQGVVELRLRERRRVWMIFPIRLGRLAISLEEPDEFVAALERASVPRVD